MRIHRLLSVACAAAALVACAPTHDAPDDSPTATRSFGAIAFAPCTLQGAGGATTEAQCARHEVAENPADPDGRRIGLHIAWLPAGNEGGGSVDPVFFLAGGPGQAATEHAASVVAALGEVRKQRDIVLIDQRGTGQSNPLDCVDAAGAPIELPDGPAPTADDYVDYARSCLSTLAGRADPRFYTTTEAVGDLDAVRTALGVEQINLVGVSYGTRVAQQYAARYPEHVRTVVLDGVAPNDLVVGGEFATTLEDALALQSAQCRKVPACRERFGTDLREQLHTVMARLKAAPVEVEYREPGTGESRRDPLTEHTVAGLAFAFSYLPQTASLLPLVVDEAAHERYGPLMSLAQMMERTMSGQMARGMQWSVVCAEDAGRQAADAGQAGTVLGPDLARMFFAPCAVWPTGRAPADFHRALASDAPTLLLSGEIDPVTPPAYAERVLQGLPNGRHFVLRGQGHNVLGVGCMPKLLGQFIESAKPAELDAACLDNLAYVPPFLSFNGWSP